MSNNIQNLEQEVLQCWGVTEDLKLLANETDDEDMQNKILGIAQVYDMRFRAAWSTYEYVVEEYYSWKPREVNFDED
jgi:hypothetical protein